MERCESERHNVFTEDINKIALSWNDYKNYYLIIRMQLTDLIETYEYGTRKVLVNDKEEIKCSNLTKWYEKWFNFMML